MTLRGATKNAKSAKVSGATSAVPSSSSRTGAGKVRLGDVCRVQYGYAFDSKCFSDVDGIPLVRIRDVVRGYSETRTSEMCPDVYRINNGDYLVGMDGEFNIAKWNGGAALLNQRVCKVIPNCNVDAGYLFYRLRIELKKIEEETSFVTVKHLSAQKLDAISFDLPLSAEQKRIAAELDQLCALKKNAEDRLAILDQIVKSRFVEMFGDFKVNDKGWRIGAVSDIATYWNGLTYKPENVTEDGVIVLRSSNVQNGVIDLTDLVRVSLDAKEKNIVRAGDVLMCSRNGSAALVGKTAIIPDGLPKMYFGAFMMIVRGKHPEFLSSFFSTRYFRDQIACGKTSTVNQITCSMMNQVCLPIPPDELMRDFAAFVAEVDKSKVTLRETVTTLDQLYRAKLQEYFG